MCRHRGHHCGSRSGWRHANRCEVHVDIERIQFKHVVMRRTGAWCCWPSIVGTCAADLPRVADDLRSLWNALGKRCGCTRNTPCHPMQHVIMSVADRCIDIVHDEHKTLRRVWCAAPRQRRRDIASHLCVLVRNHGAVSERGRRQRHGTNAARTGVAAAAAAPSRWLRGRLCASGRSLCERGVRSRHRHNNACRSAQHATNCGDVRAHLNDAGCALRQTS